MSDDLLPRLLAAWETTRDPDVEGAILRLGRQIARLRGPLELEFPDDKHAWMACAARAQIEDVDRLLDVPWQRDTEKVLPRVTALARFPPDPRIGRRLAVVMRTMPTRKRMPMLQEIAGQIVRSATPSMRADLICARAGRATNGLALVDGLLAMLDRLVVKPADPRLVAEAHARVGDGRELAMLWAEHHADPFDLQRRMVLADALEQVGDPRGEVIQLQMATSEGSLDRRLVARARRALAIHLDEWVGPLPLIDRETVRFERGFPIALVTRGSDDDLVAALDRPEWRTLEQLGAIGVPALTTLVAKLPQLARLEILHRKTATGVGPAPTVRTTILEGPWTPLRSAFPNLAIAAGCWAEIATINRVAVDARLDALVHLKTQRLDDLTRERHAGPRETRFVTERATFEPHGWYGRMWRGSSEAELIWAGNSNEHGKIRAYLLALANFGITALRHKAIVQRTTQEERELDRAFDDVRNRVAITRTGKPFDPFASELLASA